MGRALFIDDDEALLGSVRRAADVSGFTLDTASSWEEGIRLFHVLSPDVVIADYHMPESRHGLQLLAEVKRLRPSVRVILVSAYINDDDVKQINELDLVDAAMRKLDPIETVEAILHEVRIANEAPDKPTDWVDFAKARVRAGKVPQESLDRLDEFLTRHRTPSSE
jgi:CheY-like chemotaxis protein